MKLNRTARQIVLSLSVAVLFLGLVFAFMISVIVFEEALGELLNTTILGVLLFFLMINFFVTVVLWYRWMTNRDLILLHIGYFRYRWFARLIGFMLLGMAMFSISLDTDYEFFVVLQVGFLVVGAQQIIISFGRLELRTTGIMVYFRLIPWNEIIEFQWDSEDERVWRIRIKSKSLFWSATHFKVPNKKRATFEKFIARNLEGYHASKTDSGKLV